MVKAMTVEELTECMGVLFEGNLNSDLTREFNLFSFEEYKIIEDYILNNPKLEYVLEQYQAGFASGTNSFDGISFVPNGESIESMSKLQKGTRLLSRPIIDHWGIVKCNAWLIKIDFVAQVVTNISEDGLNRNGKRNGWFAIEIAGPSYQTPARLVRDIVKGDFVKFNEIVESKDSALDDVQNTWQMITQVGTNNYTREPILKINDHTQHIHYYDLDIEATNGWLSAHPIQYTMTKGQLEAIAQTALLADSHTRLADPAIVTELCAFISQHMHVETYFDIYTKYELVEKEQCDLFKGVKVVTDITTVENDYAVLQISEARRLVDNEMAYVWFGTNPVPADESAVSRVGKNDGWIIIELPLD